MPPARHHSAALPAAEAFRRHKVQPIREIDPLAIARVLDAYAVGETAQATLLWDKIERRDDRVRVVAEKRKRALAALPWEILSDEDSPEAERQKAALEHFYGNLSVSDVLLPDMRGGIRSLVRSLFNAVGFGYSALEILWQPGKDANGHDALTAKLLRVPPWFFERVTGALRLLPSPSALAGDALDPRGWLIAVSENSPLHEATCLAYIFKTMPLRDFVFFCEKFGLPWVHGKTDATPGSPEWREFEANVAALGNDCTLVTDLAANVSVQFAGGAGANTPHATLIDRMDRAIVALWTGGDLNTMSREGDSVGSLSQMSDGEMLLAEDAEFVSEQLEALSRECLRQLFGDAAPVLAHFSLRVPAKVDATRQLEIYTKAADLGVPVPVAHFRETFSLPVPDDGEETLQSGTGGSPVGTPPAPQYSASERVLECGTSVPLCAKTLVSRPGACANAGMSAAATAPAAGVFPSLTSAHGTKVPAKSGTKVPHSKTRSNSLNSGVEANAANTGEPPVPLPDALLADATAEDWAALLDLLAAARSGDRAEYLALLRVVNATLPLLTRRATASGESAAAEAAVEEEAALANGVLGLQRTYVRNELGEFAETDGVGGSASEEKKDSPPEEKKSLDTLPAEVSYDDAKTRMKHPNGPGKPRGETIAAKDIDETTGKPREVIFGDGFLNHSWKRKYRDRFKNLDQAQETVRDGMTAVKLNNKGNEVRYYGKVFSLPNDRVRGFLVVVGVENNQAFTWMDKTVHWLREHDLANSGKNDVPRTSAEDVCKEHSDEQPPDSVISAFVAAYMGH